MHVVGWIVAIVLAAVSGFNVNYALGILSVDPEAALGCFFASAGMAAAALAILWHTPPRRPRAGASREVINPEGKPCR